jgi:hypothetical protein
MSNAFASALEISAKIIRDNLAEPTTARRPITEKLHNIDHADTRQPVENRYLMNMQEGYRAVLAGMYVIAQRDEV